MIEPSTTPLPARIENGNTPKMTSRFEINAETGPLMDVLPGSAESFCWMGLGNAQWPPLSSAIPT